MIRFHRVLAALSAGALVLALVAGAADARPGGGSSAGSRGTRTFSAPAPTRTAPSTAAPIERSMTQPGITAPARAAAPATAGGLFNRPGGLFGGGFLGGLAAGFLGAGLLGLLFGSGLFGGLGGLGSIAGLLLQIALVVLVARLIWTWWQRRNAPAYAGPAYREAPTRDAPLLREAGDLQAGGGSPSGAGSDEVSIGPADFDAFERRLGDIQAAYSNEDLAALRSHVTPEMLSYFSEDLARNASRGLVNRISDVKLAQGDLAEAWREGDTDYATVAMRFSLVDQMVERASGRVVEGEERAQEATEVWTFRRARGGEWMLSAIQQA